MSRHWQRGVGLVEALVALLVLGLGMLTFVALQVKLRLGAELSRQRAEALQLAQTELEQWRAAPGLAAFDSLGPSLVTVGAPGTASYSVARSVAPVPGTSASAPATLRDVTVTVSWRDRAGQSQAVLLRTQLARADPALPATLGLRPPGLAWGARSAGLPLAATDLGDGTSLFKPAATGSVAYVLDNASAAVVRRCTGVAAAGSAGGVAAAALSAPGVRCDEVQAWLVSGVVQADGGKWPDPRSPSGPLPGALALRIDLDNTPPPAGAKGWVAQLAPPHWPIVDGPVGRTVGRGTAVYSPAECAVDAGTADAQASKGVAFAAYACLLPAVDLDADAATPPAFTARLTLWPAAGWSIGTTPGTWRVCRYSADHNRNGAVFVADGVRVAAIDNDEHPYAWLDAAKSLAHQNFLLVRGDLSCPGAAKAPQAGHYTDATTVPHQP
jgi:Tfp pilus assembly protein PilV